MDVDRHCDVSSSRTKTFEGYVSKDLFPAKEKKKKEKWLRDRIYTLSFEQEKKSWIKIDHPNYFYIYTLFPRLSSSLPPSTRFLKLNSCSTSGGSQEEEIEQKWKFANEGEGGSSTRCPWTVHLFSRNVTLALSDGNNRSGTANWPRGLIATNCSITRVHVRTHRCSNIQLLLAYTRDPFVEDRIDPRSAGLCFNGGNLLPESDTRPIKTRNCGQMAIVSRPVIILKLLQYFPRPLRFIALVFHDL